MMQLLVVALILVGVGATWWGGGQPSFFGRVATTSLPTEIIATVETSLDDSATTIAHRTAEVFGSSTLGSPRVPNAAYADFPLRYPMTIGTVAVEASVATSVADRIRGLSGTPVLPSGVVKLFVFPTDGPQSIWMKDMAYPIDIMWLDSAGVVVHIAPAVDPATYPESFSSPVPARYVVEAPAGFAATHSITLGTKTELPILR